ncbi:FUSC family protein [Microbacterium fluvii]
MHAVGAALRSLFHFHRSPVRRWPLALQAALGIAVPITVFTLAGLPQLGFQASAGAFTVIFASQLPTVERARLLPLIGAGLVACAALGALLSASDIAVLIGLFVVTAASSAVAYGRSLGPPGPVFFVLVYGLSANAARATDAVGAAIGVAALAGGVAVAYLIAMTPLLHRRNRRIRARPLRQLAPRADLRGSAGTLLVRAVAVGTVGTLIGALGDPHRAYWIVGAGIAVVGVASRRQLALERGIHRVIGTVVGAGLFLLVAQLPLTGLWLALVMGGLQFVIELVVVRNYALALTFITPLVLLLTTAATGTIDTTVVSERIIDTLIGALLGAVSGLLHTRAEPPSR